MVALCGSNPYRKELDGVKERYEKTAARVRELEDTFLVAEEKKAEAESMLGEFAKRLSEAESLLTEKQDRISEKVGEVSSLQTLVENLRERIDEKDAQMAQMNAEFESQTKRYKERIAEIRAQLEMPESTLNRELNVGFSGGEKKKIEMLQLLLLKPKLAILDETDSGLDVDALQIVSRGIEAYRADCDGALLMITHNTRILEKLSVDRTHVMVKGNLVAEGPASLIDDIDANGFGRFEGAVEKDEA